MADGTAERCFIPLSDGARLAVTLFLPAVDGPVPCVLEALPYRKDDLTASYRPEYVRLRDEHSYAVARIDVRGTGSSDGLATDEYPVQEQRDLCEAIAWLADQPWCTGSVGMYGTSYSGFNALQVACERPPELKAICAIYATDDRYTDDVHYMGGALRLLDVVDYPVYMVAMNALPAVPTLVGVEWRDQWRERVERLEPWLLRWLDEQRDSAYWRHGSVRPAYDRIACPTMLVGGWADGYRNNTFRTVAALREAGTPHQLLLGPWAHASTATSLPGPHVDLVPVMARWWDRWLRGIEVDTGPALTWYAQRSTKPSADRAVVDGEWRCAPSWPLPGAHEDVRPLGDGLVTYDVRPDVGTSAWNSCSGSLPWGQPTDQRFDDAASLTWEWPADGLSLLGHPRVALRLASSQPVASVSVKLCDLWPDGTSSLLSRGLLNLTHRASSADPAPVQVDEMVDVVVELEAMSWEASPGHLLRLSLAGVDWPNTVAPPLPVTLTVDRAASSLVLPIAGESSVADGADFVTDRSDDPRDGVTWTVSTDVLQRRTTCGVDHGSEDESDLASTVEHYTGSVSVDHDTFAQRVEASADFTVRWPEAVVRSLAELSMDAGSTSFDVELTLRAWDGGELFASRHWSRSIPRDLG